MPHTIMLVRSGNVAWDGLREALARERRGDIRVIAAIDDAAAALMTVTNTCPDLVLTRTPVPGMDLAAFVAALKRTCPQVRLVVIPDDPTLLTKRDLVELATYGVAGAILWSDITTPSLDHWLRTVLAGMTVHSAAILAKVLSAAKPVVSIQEPPDGFEQLTQRERDVLALVAKGLPDKEVAQQLGIHYRTVESHVTNLIKKLNARTRIRLGVLANEAGLGNG